MVDKSLWTVLLGVNQREIKRNMEETLLDLLMYKDNDLFEASLTLLSSSTQKLQHSLDLTEGIFILDNRYTRLHRFTLRYAFTIVHQSQFVGLYLVTEPRRSHFHHSRTTSVASKCEGRMSVCTVVMI
jgi:hypothetical protein